MSELHVVMYHYVRDLPRTAYPNIRGMLVDDFRAQVDWLRGTFEMATLECALAYLHGEYVPDKDLCLLTFDDGLKEHYSEVLPILAERQVQGLFGIITGCLEDQLVAPVHMNHFLTAALGFEEYRPAFLAETERIAPGLLARTRVDAAVAERSYPLDTREMASFKMLINFHLKADVRDATIRNLFARHFGAERDFACELYMSWEEVRQLQENGMLIAGHTHSHRPLSTLDDAELVKDVRACRSLLDRNLHPQALWPFSYPYGKRNSYSGQVIKELHAAKYHCAFGTEAGCNVPGTPVFELFRVDCNGAEKTIGRRLAA